MTSFPAVEAYRRELRAMDYRRMDDAELDEAERRHAVAHHNNVAEGVHPGAEQEAF